MKKKSSIYMYVLRLCVLLILFVVLLLCNSAAWLLETFGPMDFSIVLYQLNSPLQGTGHEILSNYLMNCVVKSVQGIFLFGLIWFIVTSIHKKLQFRVVVRIFNKEINLYLNAKRWKYARIIAWGGVILGCAVSMHRYINLVGIPQYMQTIRTASTLYEDEYVPPDAVEITFPEQKKNLLFIYLESMETTYASVEAGGGKKINYIPNLTELANQNISFSNTDKLGGIVSYSGSGWTMASLMASTSGVPYRLPIEGNSAGDYEKILPGAVSLGEILENAGYHNYFMCGSDASFGGRKLYFEEHGDYEILDYYAAIEDGLIPKGYYEFWGFEDQKLFQYAKDKLTEIANSGQSFNFTMLTADTHHMEGYICELCEEEYPEQYANVITCADRQITEFVKWVQEQSWYEDTVIILVGDHTSMNKTFWDDIPEEYDRRTYNCFINTGKENVNMKNRKVYSMDLLPTTLGAMGVQIDGDRLGLGTNLFSDKNTLAEEMDNFGEESLRYSNYYYKNLIMN